MAELPRIAVVRNPRSGTAPEPAVLEQAFRAAQIDARFVDTPDPRDMAQYLDRIAGESDVVVAAGGDGTVSGVAAAVARAGKTLAVIPTGTLNHFARDAGIPIELEQAIALITSGRERRFDLGIVNEHLFLNNVSLGSYPRMVKVRDALETNGRSRTLATAIAVARTWWRLRKLTATLLVDDRQLHRRSPFIVVGNGSYVLAGLSLGKREEISDGRLSLYVAPSTGRIGALSLPFRALAGRLESYERFETFCAEAITAQFSHPRIEAAIDGEVRVLASPLRFTIRRAALRVLVPA